MTDPVVSARTATFERGFDRLTLYDESCQDKGCECCATWRGLIRDVVSVIDGHSTGATATVTTSSDAVTVHAIIEPPHDFVEMHHYGNPDGLHYCPTGFAMCTGMHDGVQTDCTEIREFDGDCRLWGRSSDEAPASCAPHARREQGTATALMVVGRLLLRLVRRRSAPWRRRDGASDVRRRAWRRGPSGPARLADDAAAPSERRPK